MTSQIGRFTGPMLKLSLVATVSLATGALAAESAESRSEAGCTRCQGTTRSRTIAPGWTASQRFSLVAAHKAAARKLSKSKACRALFDSLDLDGPDALARLQYRPPRSTAEQQQCDRGRVAFTTVGSSEIRVCSGFHRLPRRTKITILIHEALHTAGMSEAPHDPEAPTSIEITHRVRRACSL